MFSGLLPKNSKRITYLLYLIIIALVIGIIYSLQRQTGSSSESKVIEAGLIESGDRPAMYFNLRNTGQNYANYTYTVTYNSTDGSMMSYNDSITVPPGRTFQYTISLVRPSQGVMVLNLRIYEGNERTEANLLYGQTWYIRAEA